MSINKYLLLMTVFIDLFANKVCFGQLEQSFKKVLCS